MRVMFGGAVFCNNTDKTDRQNLIGGGLEVKHEGAYLQSQHSRGKEERNTKICGNKSQPAGNSIGNNGLKTSELGGSRNMKNMPFSNRFFF